MKRRIIRLCVLHYLYLNFEKINMMLSKLQIMCFKYKYLFLLNNEFIWDIFFSGIFDGFDSFIFNEVFLNNFLNFRNILTLF